MKRAIGIPVFFCILLLFGAAASAISTNDAVAFVTRDNHFLFIEENNQVPVSPISFESKKYWVVPVVNGEDLVTYFPVKYEKAELLTYRPTNRELFKTADILRELNLEKEKLSKNQTAEWFFTNYYVLVFNELGSDFKTETYELNIIETTLEDSKVTSQISKIRPVVLAISLKANDVSQKISSASIAESDFFSTPTPEKADALKGSFDDVFNAILELNKAALDYRNKIDSLKQAISISDADAQAKDYTIKLASPPTSFNNIGKYTSSSLSLSQDIETIYQNVLSRSDSLLNEFESRIKRNDAFNAVYGENQKLKAQTNGEITTIQKGVEVILLNDNRPYWKNQELIKTLDSKWQQTQREFNSRNYDGSALFSGKVADDIIAIYKQGFVENQAKPLISQELLLQIIAGLVVLLVMLILYNKRDKILNMGKETEKEVDISAWKER